jgi:hypothetical protein
MLRTKQDLQRIEHGIGRHDVVIICVLDFYDETTAYYMKILRTKYDIVNVCSVESVFPNVSTCTLHPYHSPKTIYLLAREKKKK